jgi:hypothetical protein
MATKKKVTDDYVEQPSGNAPTPSPRVDNANRADLGGDVVVPTGSFCRVVDGEHAGRYGVVLEHVEWFDGGPAMSIVRTRDDDDMLIMVDTGSLTPAQAGGR